jgi:hypothetical protein
MERTWLFDRLAVSVATVDFLDPALAGEPQARERGVRVEVRPVSSATAGSVYSSPTLTLLPAVCRIDLLESDPGAADRMHWHPVMDAGEPGDRVFDPSMPADPLAWLAARLESLDEVLAWAGVVDREGHDADVAAVAAASSDIVAVAREGLAWARQPWPVVRHDERGMAPA